MSKEQNSQRIKKYLAKLMIENKEDHEELLIKSDREERDNFDEEAQHRDVSAEITELFEEIEGFLKTKYFNA